MEYKKDESEYKDDKEGNTKYYVTDEAQQEAPNLTMPTFDQLFYNIPKGGSIAADPEYHNGVIYFPSLDTHIYALDAESGEMIWKFKTGAPTLSTPVVHNGRIYFGSNDNQFYCVDLDGNLVWKKNLGDIIVSYPSAVGDKIFIPAGKIMFCFSENGKEEWRFQTGDGLLIVPKIINEKVFISSYDKNVYALDMQGRLKWKFTAGGPLSSPLIMSGREEVFTIKERSHSKMMYVENPILYMASSDNNLYALTEDGKLIWKFNSGSSFASALAGSKNTIYAGTISGYMFAIDTEGQKKWSFRTGGMVTAAPTIAKEKIYVNSWDGKIYCLSEGGEKIWDFLTGGPIAAESIVVGNKIYFGSADTFFYCLGIDKRSVEWTFQCGFGLPEQLQTKITQVSNAFTEHDKKIFKVWIPEMKKTSIPGAIMQNYNVPVGFDFAGESTYSSSAGHKFGKNYLSKRKPYEK